jgi:hypothetical protein
MTILNVTTIHNVMVTTRCLVVSGVAVALSFVAFVAQAQENAAVPSLTLRSADPAEKGDGTLSPAAKAAIEHGPLPISDAVAAAKAAANRVRDEAEKSGASRPFSSGELAPAGGAGAGPLVPAIVGGINKSGLGPGCCSPPDTTGAIGPSSFVQLVNGSFSGFVNPNAGIFNRTTGTLIASGTLDQLAGISSTIESFDVQVIWDPTTNRFYYTMDSIFSSTDNRLSFGFSKTSAPSNVTTDWCHYTLAFGTRFPDYPKLGDSQFFAIIGVNSFNPGFVGSDLIAISKPAAGTACPAASTFKVGEKLNLVDSSGAEVFTPVPANQVDTAATGFVVARNGALPATKLWFFNVTKGGTGFPVFGAARGVTVGSYAVPAAASQPVFTQVLDTLDGRNTQAVQATDPRLSNKFAFWTQHTIGSGTVSAVRWYEIDPVPATPVVLRSANITSTCFLYNAAISPDRRVDGATSAFGNSFVIQFNQSGNVCGVNPRILAGSSVNGGALSFLVVKAAVGPYRDFTCQPAGSTCRWGDYSAANPDPKPTVTGSGEVWGTNQYSGVVSPPPAGVNWRTEFFALKP